MFREVSAGQGGYVFEGFEDFGDLNRGQYDIGSGGLSHAGLCLGRSGFVFFATVQPVIRFIPAHRAQRIASAPPEHAYEH
jgi:hypothetical protein